MSLPLSTAASSTGRGLDNWRCLDDSGWLAEHRVLKTVDDRCRARGRPSGEFWQGLFGPSLDHFQRSNVSDEAMLALLAPAGARGSA